MNNNKKSQVCLGFILIFKLHFLSWQTSPILLSFHTDRLLFRPHRPLCGKTSKKQKSKWKTPHISRSLQPWVNLLLEEKEAVSEGWAAQPSAQVGSELAELSSRQPHAHWTLPAPAAGGQLSTEGHRWQEHQHLGRAASWKNRHLRKAGEGRGRNQVSPKEQTAFGRAPSQKGTKLLLSGLPLSECCFSPSLTSVWLPSQV